MHTTDNDVARPFLKWVGGKRWFAKQHSNLMPTTFNKYIEPFLGGGALYFSLSPEDSVLADINPALIEVYTAIKNNWQLVWRYLQDHQHQHSPDYYYAIRPRRYRSPYSRAAHFLYLNRACWNGLYRVNREGQFNVPIGTKQAIILDDDDFASVAKLLSNAELLISDFEPVIDMADEGDFVFVDPPYTINHNLNGFLKYNEKIFSWRDQVRLKSALVRAHSRGVKILITNADHKSLRDLYSNFGSMQAVPRHSVLSANAKFRRASTELAIKIGY